MRVLIRIVCALVVTLAMSPPRLGAVDAATKRAMDNYVIVSFGFDVSRDGHISNIRVALYMNPSDKRELKNMLSRKEQEMGARIIALGKLKIAPQDYGKTWYRALIFDKRTRKYKDKT